MECDVGSSAEYRLGIATRYCYLHFSAYILLVARHLLYRELLVSILSLFSEV